MDPGNSLCRYSESKSKFRSSVPVCVRLSISEGGRLLRELVDFWSSKTPILPGSNFDRTNSLRCPKASTAVFIWIDLRRELTVALLSKLLACVCNSWPSFYSPRRLSFMAVFLMWLAKVKKLSEYKVFSLSAKLCLFWVQLVTSMGYFCVF